MQKRTREILAVLLLGLLLLAGVGAMGYYIFIGHNWNVAASHIDDSIGQMDGYTVILYEGTMQMDDEGKEEAEAKSETAQAVSESVSEQAQVTDMRSAVESYREKGANVFVLDTVNLSRYNYPIEIAKNGMCLGLLSVGKSTLRSVARADARYLSKQGVDYTIAITNDVKLHKAAAEGLIGDVSIIVCDDPEGEFPNGQYYGSTYCVHTPYVGEIGAIVVSPSGVLTTKTLDGLQEP